MTDFRADPAKTFAVVVGIEKYGIPGADLDGPVRDACRFVRWLRGREIPADNIHLFTSPLESNAADLMKLDVSWQLASREAIHRCFTDTLPGTAGDLLLLFWGGHGLLTEGERRLFFADATEVAPLNLDLNSLLHSLRCDLFAGLSRQVVIIDACANHVEHLRDPEVFPCRLSAPGCEQFVLYAAKPGEVASNDAILKAGVFSSAVLDELERPSAQIFPPDFSALFHNLAGRFEMLRQEGRTDQTPVFWWRLDWSGDSIESGHVPNVAGDRAKEPASLRSIEDEFRSVLRPLMADQASRKTRLYRAFAAYPALVDRIDVHGETGVFLTLLHKTLREYGEVEAGKEAVCVLLEKVRDEVGLRDRERIERIIHGYPR